MSDPEMIMAIQASVHIPVMAKVRIGHFVGRIDADGGVRDGCAGGGRLLLTAHRAPSQWRTASPDLKSRLNALPVGEIGPPDDTVVRARLAIAAERRFLRLSPETLNYLVPRLELAYDAVENFMDRLSDAVSDHDRAPSLPLARRVLEQMSEAAGDDVAEG